MRVRRVSGPAHHPATSGDGSIAIDARVHELTRPVEHDGVLDEVAIEEPLEIRVDGRRSR